VRFAWLALVLACSKSPKPNAEGSGSAGPTPPPMDAPVVVAAPDGGPVLVDLFRTVPLEVEVSSRVANSKIKLEHLVDRDLKTAWNSRTDALNNAISIEIPKDVTVYEVRMTVGHTGTGPKGEDYFTMNRRITRVRLTGKFAELQSALDPNVRGLQVIRVPAHTDGTLTIHLDSWLDGSKKNWKEICVSEVELWGTAAKATPNAKPRLRESPDSIASTLCDGKIRDSAYPECQISPMLTFDKDVNPLPAPWIGVSVIDIVTSRSEHHGHLYGEGIERSLVLVAGTDAWTSDVVDHSSFDDPGDGTGKSEHSEFTIDDVRVAKGKKLVIRYTVKDPQAVPSAGVPSFEVTCSLDKTCEPPVALPVQHNE
jgi:hypothetical protein